MKKRKNILKEAAVLLIVATLFLSTAVTGYTKDENNEVMNPSYLKTDNLDPSVESEQPIRDSALFSQLPYEPYEEWIFYTSDSDPEYRVHDEYWNVSEPICDIHWWGLSLYFTGSGWENCDPEGMCFEIIFWDSLLGNPVCTYTDVCPSAESTGKFYSGYEMFYWETFLDPCCDQIPNGWVSIQSISSPNGCWLLWAGSDEGDMYCYQENADDPDQDTDAAFELTGGCNASIDVEKYVWDPDTYYWVDADTENESLDLPICTDAKFLIVIHNDGCCPIFNINVTDIMHDSLEFIIADPDPDGFEYYPPYYYIYWLFSGPLSPGDTITINITAHVAGPECSIDYNYVEVEASSDCEPFTVTDQDYAYVHAYENDPPAPPVIQGPSEGKIGWEYDFRFYATDPNDDDVYYYIEWGDGNILEWIGPYYSGYQVTFSHTWEELGTFTIKAKAKDGYDLESDWSEFVVTIVEDPPPTAPIIKGKTSGKAGEEYEYTFNSEDPDGDFISYFVDWGDETTSGWTAYFPSGNDVKIKHTWSTQGAYKIIAKAKNFDGLISPEGTLDVNMPRYKPFSFNFNLAGWLFEHFPILEVFLRAMNLLRYS